MTEKNGALTGPLRTTLLVVIALSFGLYFLGLSDIDEDSAPVFVSQPPADDGAPPDVRTYEQLRESPMYSQVRSWIEDQDRLKKNTPGYLDEVKLEGTSKEAVLQKQAKNRAFDGAPPTVPHPVIQTEWPDCLVCHEKGIKINGRTASAMSHEMMHNCTQCHTTSTRQDPAREPAMADDNIPWENSFVGKASATKGPRAFSIGPPQSPHTTHMRERCDSCHGLNGALAIRSSHPHRLNCQQCHTAAAANDQRVTLALPAVENE
jgi:nitrate reductase (cytochrome), electron transfer subunit